MSILEPNGHTVECNQLQEQEKAARQAWLKRWPDACLSCHAMGVHYSSYDPSPAGVSLSSGSYIDADPCSSCMEAGRCPRCGKHAFDDDGLSLIPWYHRLWAFLTLGTTITMKQKCYRCGWTGKDEDDTVPYVMDGCDCWEQQMLHEEPTMMMFGYSEGEL